MMKRKIIQVGHSCGITIPPAVLDNLGLKKGDTVGVVLKRVSVGERYGKEEKRK